MKILNYKLPPDFNLFLGGDNHIGAAARSSSGFRKLVDMLHSSYGGLGDDRNFYIDHGDVIEAIMTDDKRFQSATTKMALILDQIYEALRQYDPIKTKTLCILHGNHELKLHRFGNIVLDFCKRLFGDERAHRRYGTFSAKLVYRDLNGEVYFRHFATHGRKSIGSVADDPERQIANMRIQLKRHMYRKAGDCLIQSKGHTHRLFHRAPFREIYLTDNGEELEQRYTTQNMESKGFIHPDSRWYFNTGSFLRTFVPGEITYSEAAEYDPTELGFYILPVRDGVPQHPERVTV